MQFSAIVLDPTLSRQQSHKDGLRESKGKTRQLKLWGLTLGMTLDLLGCMHTSSPRVEKGPRSPTDFAFKDKELILESDLAPSMTFVNFRVIKYVPDDSFIALSSLDFHTRTLIFGYGMSPFIVEESLAKISIGYLGNDTGKSFVNGSQAYVLEGAIPDGVSHAKYPLEQHLIIYSVSIGLVQH